MIYIGADGSTTCTGLVAIDDQVQIVAAFAARAPGKEIVERCMEIAEQVREFVTAIPPKDRRDAVLAVEWQEHRAKVRERNPQAVIDCQTATGIVLASFHHWIVPPRVLAPSPSQWKGQIAKQTHHAALCAKYPQAEALRKMPGPSDRHDAFGLAVWAQRSSGVQSSIERNA